MRLLAEEGGFSMAEVGITALCLLYVIKMLLDYFSKNKEKSSGSNDVEKLALQTLQAKLDDMAANDSNFRRDVYVGINQTKDLHDWHNVNDGDGRKIWYVKASLEAAMKENTATVNKLINKIESLED